MSKLFITLKRYEILFFLLMTDFKTYLFASGRIMFCMP